MKRVGIIIVNWNGFADTVQCLNSVLACSYANRQIFVIDNGSDNNEGQRLLALYSSNVTVVLLLNNSGFTGANNLGISLASQQGAEAILLLNNDTVVKSDFLEPMVSLMDDGKVGVVGATIYYYGSEVLFCYGGGSTNFLLDRFTLLGNKKRRYVGTEKPGFISGCALLLRTEALNTVGNLDDRFFLYNEEVDLCLRMKAAGYCLEVAPKSIIWHKVARSTKYLSPIYVYYMMRNKLLLARKHLSRPRRLLFFVVFFCKEWLGYTILLIINKRAGSLQIPLVAIVDYFRGNFGKVPSESRANHSSLSRS